MQYILKSWNKIRCGRDNKDFADWENIQPANSHDWSRCCGYLYFKDTFWRVFMTRCPAKCIISSTVGWLYGVDCWLWFDTQWNTEKTEKQFRIAAGVVRSFSGVQQVHMESTIRNISFCFFAHTFHVDTFSRLILCAMAVLSAAKTRTVYLPFNARRNTLKSWICEIKISAEKL